MPVLRIGKMVCRCPNAMCALCVRFSAYVCRQFPPHTARLLQTVAGARRMLNKLSGLFYHQATGSNRWRGHEVVLRVENDGACKHTGTPLPGIRVSVSNEVSVVNSQTVDDESNNFVGLTYPPSSRPTRLRVRRSESAAVPCQLWGMGCKGAADWESCISYSRRGLDGAIDTGQMHAEKNWQYLPPPSGNQHQKSCSMPIYSKD